jgi:N6-L-threonylcarbamoyladenine synthase
MVDAGRLVLGIETSCDDTSVAVLENGATLRAHLIAAQDLHALYGGVVPELAARAHLELLPRMVEHALDEAGVTPEQLTAIAVTHAPGLVGSLVVGVAFAKAYGLALGIPVIGVNHIEAHLHATALEHGEGPLPAVSLVVSGGHTELVEVRALGEYRWLGSTRDDAAGEAYDKVAKLLGLGFPGGPVLDRLARDGDPAAFDFPRPMLDRPGLDFSFSGLKTAVALAVAPHGAPPYPERLTADVAASFQRAVVDTLAAKSMRAVASRATASCASVSARRAAGPASRCSCPRRASAPTTPP